MTLTREERFDYFPDITNNVPISNFVEIISNTFFMDCDTLISLFLA